MEYISTEQELHYIHNHWMKQCSCAQRIISQFLFEGCQTKYFAGVAEPVSSKLGQPTFITTKNRYATAEEYYYWFIHASQVFPHHIYRAHKKHPNSVFMYDIKEANIRVHNFYKWLAKELAEIRHVSPGRMRIALNRYFYGELEVTNMTTRELSNVQEILHALAPYVVVCGSYARREERNSETYSSDIDMFIRSRPRDEIDFEISNETYMDEILDVINSRELINDSDGPGSIAILPQRHVPIMFDMNTRFKLPITNKLFYREIFGVPMMCCVDDKHASDEVCWDNPEWSDAACDVVIDNPIPKYAPDSEV